MKIFSLCLLMVCFACGTDDTSSADPAQSSADSETSDVTTPSDTQDEADTTDTDTTNPEDVVDTETSDTEETDTEDSNTDETEIDPNQIGSVPASCGAEGQGLVPVDCTEHGDVNATCVFSNHCACSLDDGFECEEPRWEDSRECAEGSTCISKED